ncbi:alpha/beta hydrolase [Candidatus Saccharibacteria bacterium]|nr:MAG: alpha/beta hydrolase [Candidatus Saccharibacteria bacterium]
MKRFLVRAVQGKILARLLLIVLLAVIAYGVWWITFSYGAEPDKLAAARQKISIQDTSRGYLLKPIEGDHKRVGIIFVPGGRVDPLAYAYNLSDIVAEGYTVVITKPLFNLAVLDLRAVGTLLGDEASVDTWVAAGHSLGGSKACAYARESGRIEGVILFASYCTKPTDGPILNISGSLDPFTTQKSIAEHTTDMPQASYAVAEGANHAQFGSYGAQTDDAIPDAQDEAVRRYVTSQCLRWLKRFGD